jgi:plastocyanin
MRRLQDWGITAFADRGLAGWGTLLRAGALCAAALVIAGPHLAARAADGINGQIRGGRNGTIRGRVDLRRALSPVEARPNVADLGTSNPRDTSDRLRSVVYLETAPRGAFEQTEPAQAVMDQRNETFVPHLLAITTGTTVAFPNSDRIYHNVFSLSKTRTFDLGRYAVGHSKSIRFDRAGIVRVFCDIHSHMSAFILVFSHPYFAITEPDGRYHIDGVPAGSYNVIAWNEGLASDPKPIAVTDGGVVELEFTLR